MTRGLKPKYSFNFRSFWRSVWLFPAALTVILILLTSFKISGSSIGQYHTLLYGSQKDSSLILGTPRAIRSDEWLVRTPKTIAQSNNSYSRINQNIGAGEDESVSLDQPYKDWSTIFRPLDWPFFVIGFDYAFALKWWLMGYLLIISVYFFTLKLLPGKRLLAACLGLALFFSPFVQWWYEYDTLASLFYSLFLGIASINLIKARLRRSKLFFSALLGFLLTCFALVLYPPFQVACGLALAAFVIGYVLEIRLSLPKRELMEKIGYGLAAALGAGMIVLVFLHTRPAAVHALESTVYPGKRITNSGGFSFSNLMSGSLDFQLQFSSKAAKYLVAGPTNQSEASNFILLLPFLFLPSIYMLWTGWRKDKRLDWPLLVIDGLFVLIMIRMFVPLFSPVFKLLALNRVPHQRLVIGLGLLSIVQTILVIRWLLAKRKARDIPQIWILVYSAAVLIFELILNFHIKNSSPGFIGDYRTVAFSLPIPVITYLLLARKYALGAAVLTLFCAFTCFMVNPLYRGTTVLTNTPLSNQIKTISARDDGRWIAEGLVWENFPQMNGARSLSGTYSYPQLSLWARAGRDNQQSVYNRYAHVEFVIDRSGSGDSTKLSLVGPDHFQVITTLCSSFLKDNDVHYLLTEAKLRDGNCSKLLSTISYPGQIFYIYHLN